MAKKEKRYEVWEGNILRASQKTMTGANMFMKPGRKIKERNIRVND